MDAWDKRSDLVHWEDLEGSGGEGDGRRERDGEHMETHGCFISMYDKIHYNKKKKDKLEYYETSENKDTVCQNLWDTPKTVLRGKYNCKRPCFKKKCINSIT